MKKRNLSLRCAFYPSHSQGDVSLREGFTLGSHHCLWVVFHPCREKMTALQTEMTDSWCWANCSTCQTQGSDIQLSLPTARAVRTQHWFEVSINNFLSNISTHLLPFIFRHQGGYKESPQFSPSLFMFSPLSPSLPLLGVQIYRQARSICDSCSVCREPCEML